MSFIDGLAHRIRSVFRADSAARERDDEFAFHESLASRDLGSDRDAARREFGNATYLKEEVRWMGAMRWIDAVRQDVRYGLRALRRAPVFALVAIVSIGFGIGANTAVFGMVYQVLLQRLAIPRADELVMLKRARVAYGEMFGPEEARAISSAPGVKVALTTQTFSQRTEID